MSFPFQTIVVPTDFSELGNAAVPVAFRLAKDQGARVILFHALVTAVPFYWEFYTPALSPKDVESLEARSREKLLDLVPAAHRDKVPFEVLLRHGDPSTEICALAKSNMASLIVISSHGRSGVGRFLIGSVAERVVRHSSCPVLVLR